MSVLIRRAGPISIDNKKYSKQWLETNIAISRDGRRNLDSDLELDPTRPPRAGTKLKKFVDHVGKLEPEERLNKAIEVITKGNLANLAPLLPLLFSLKGDPYHLGDHYPFAPFFSSTLPRRILFKTARQVAKSTSMAAQGVLKANTIPFFNTLYITPLYEMIRRFSSNYVRGFIDQSPVRNLFVDTTCSSNVLQRSFKNYSTMFFSFAFLDADRTRGLNTDKTAYDECQDLDAAHVPIIRETMSGSKWGFEQFTGTPKTLENFIEKSWLDSSQAQWHIWCKACGKENIPTVDHDLDAMTGPSIVKREVSERMPGCVCAKCGRPIYPRTGRWVHHIAERRIDFAGYHIPQHIMPMHFADPEKWGVLLGKRDGFGPTPENVYYNEACGESSDTGARLITQTELKAACEKRPNSLEWVDKHLGDYTDRVVAVDWGGGGEKEVSFTAIAVLGITPSGKIDVLFGHRFRSMHNYAKEASAIIYLMKRCRADHCVHDFGGQGAVREHLLVSAGIPLNQLIPVSYQGASAGSIMKAKEENMRTGKRNYYMCDKPRSLVQTCELIRYGQLRFFEYDYKGVGQAGLLHDFLSLVEDTVGNQIGTPMQRIIRDEKGGPDDFAQAVNIGSCALFYKRGVWPDLAKVADIKLDSRLIQQMSPIEPNWDEF